MQPVYIPYEQIDKKKWDHCITHAYNGLVYGESVFLDAMATHWDALVFGNYEAVMPVTWRRKYSITYLYQPAFIQQGGIYSAAPLPEDVIRSFLIKLMEKFSFAEIALNFGNTIENINPISIRKRNNFTLSLENDYASIQSQFHPSIKRKLKSLLNLPLRYESTDRYEQAIELYQKLYGHRIKSVKNIDYTHFTELCAKLWAENRLVVRSVYSTDNNELLAQVLLLKDKNRLYNIIPCVTEQGKQLLANYYLYNELIKEFTQQSLLLDFEGSDIPGVAFFYEKFAQDNQTYPFVKFNRLPFPFRLFKR